MCSFSYRLRYKSFLLIEFVQIFKSGAYSLSCITCHALDACSNLTHILHSSYKVRNCNVGKKFTISDFQISYGHKTVFIMFYLNEFKLCVHVLMRLPPLSGAKPDLYFKSK